VSGLWSALGIRGRVLVTVLLALLLAVPLVADRYVLSVLIMVFYFVLVGQAWNLMMGFAGQLSLGHALYVGLGGYVGALLWTKFGIGPWLGVFAAMAVAVAFGTVIGWLGFRFGIEGVYFALLTIAFAEFTRIAFEHWDYAGAAGGLFLRVEDAATARAWNLRGGPLTFYYVGFALAAAATLLTAWLKGTRLGYQWRAVREDEAAARALGIGAFRVKMAAVVISAALTAIGGVFLAFYSNNLFPDRVFDIGRSIELILAPIVGGLGTVFGPVLGAFILTPLGEMLTAITEQFGLNAPGAKALVYGLALMTIIIVRPSGVWPWLARLLGPEKRP
jgi:branched-chain amino acid transport system permease protein